MSPELNFEVVSMNEVPLDGPRLVGPRKPLVLVVDDERLIADTLSAILSRNGFSTATAYDSNMALEMANLAPPELLLSDVWMGPGMNGAELAIAFVERWPGCKVLLFSGHASTVDLLVKARESGHDFSLLTKPIHPADLLARIRESLHAGPVAALA
jgi:DNA-binding response OmpR family regulator